MIGKISLYSISRLRLEQDSYLAAQPGQCVGRGEQINLDQLWGNGLVRGEEETLSRSEEECQAHQMPQLKQVQPAQQRDNEDRDGASSIRAEQDEQAREAVCRDATDQEEDELRDARGDQDDPHRRAGMGQEKHLPGQRCREREITHARDRLSGPEQGKWTRSKRACKAKRPGREEVDHGVGPSLSSDKRNC